MRILGIASDLHISSAALIEDGQVVAAAAEERFIRSKHTRAFPARAIDYCLSSVPDGLRGVDRVAVSTNPAIDLSVPDGRYAGRARWHPEGLYSIPNNLAPLVDGPYQGHATQILQTADKPLQIDYVYHHDAHAANAFFLSPFESAAILTVDGRGEDCTALSAIGDGTTFTTVDTIPYPHSVGLLYGAVTQYLGFRIDRDEWKVMGLAAYGDPDSAAYKALRDLVDFKDGTVRIDLNYFGYYLRPSRGAVSDAFIDRFGPARQPGEAITSRHHDVAAAVQHVLEDALRYLLMNLHRQTGVRRAVLGGGSFMNSVFNGKITSSTPFDEIFISSCPDDSGTAIGAALYTHCVLLGADRGPAMTHNYYGPSFNQASIDEVLSRAKLRAPAVEDPAAAAAHALAEGKIVGWFQGRMEFGQRALGNRSILADPRSAHMRDQVNDAVKFREPWRPFAPAVLAEDFAAYFGSEPPVPFMERTLPVRPEAQSLIPAAVHVDGTARPQTVSADTNPLFHQLISRFRDLTGVGAVLNTSFNLAEEPIVCAPQDAIRTFYSSGLDLLVLGNRVLTK
ncbi:carbamoyltransferase family protein [Streptomyces prunicolor]|uniref:carbamoyltransferase family protein n=1 Tax=Streptomyces prunicolor TaxID=67348 RepID=UPI00037EAF72|nr:carbamoyltransferase C-terminal domain-containing protein [Streptomyces prunicolor]